MTQQAVTQYFPGEGREFMRECITLAVEACVHNDVSHLVIFTGTGEGPHFAARELLSRPEYGHLKITAVTPPVGRTYRTTPGDKESPTVRAGINPAMRDELLTLGIEIVSAHLLFKEVHDGHERSSEWRRVAEAYGVLGGGFALCVQALLVACDFGVVPSGQRVVVAAADTAFIALGCRTESFLSPVEGLLVEHIVCRPMRYTISKRLHGLVGEMWGVSATALPAPAQLAAVSPLPELSAAPTQEPHSSNAPPAVRAPDSVQLAPAPVPSRRPAPRTREPVAAKARPMTKTGRKSPAKRKAKA